MFLPPDRQFRDRQIITDFVDQLIIPNYQLLTERSGELATAIDAFVANPNDSTLQAAREAWLEARSPWEQSEAFAFGPAASLGLDAELDDWPINETDVQAVLNSSDALTPEYVDGLQTSQKGFHAIGFLLFGTDNDKSLEAFTPRELEYLGAIAPVFDQTANDLLTSWTEGLEGYPPYRSEFVNAGEGSTAYPTVQAAGEEIVQGILGILDELGNVKIGEALEAQNPFLLESRFSQSSLQDFQDNLISAQNAYLGEFPAAGTDGSSLSDFIVAIDPSLDAQIREQIQTTLAALAEIPAPIEQTLCDRSAQPQIEAAQASVMELFETFEQRVLPLMQQ
ncbi:MAG: peptidase M75 [Leptolyngbyaceae cyanobacterium RM2_2_4]|nr:peptidase M75 [Leptolyngbyaceae cyanobacterium SM1_4_3]NJO48364.1 peptidase M75 [Leptolyngbyaceae cyanobacterium RM2_2_4]